MSRDNFPAGWDEEKVRRVLAYYEDQTEEDALLEHEAGVEPAEKLMSSSRSGAEDSGTD